jgi:hypothetical protein
MSDNRARRLDGKQRLIAPLVIGAAIVLVVTAALVTQAMLHRPQAPQAPAASPPVASAAPTPPVAATQSPPMDRQDLLRQANAVAAAFAADGRQAPAGPDPMVGRRFDVAIPFGCEGPGAAPPGAQQSVDYDPDEQTVRLTAHTATWTSLPLVQDLPDVDKIEAVEGFWIPHPWVFAESCPAVRKQPEPATPTPPAGPTLGLAQVFEKGASRVQRRGDRPYEFVRRLPKGDSNILSHAYRLRLQGRIVGFKGGRALHCWSESPDHRPICLFAVAFDRVAIEDASDGQVLAEWPD